VENAFQMTVGVIRNEGGFYQENMSFEWMIQFQFITINPPDGWMAKYWFHFFPLNPIFPSKMFHVQENILFLDPTTERYDSKKLGGKMEE
jgi:hypothetical protein